LRLTINIPPLNKKLDLPAHDRSKSLLKKLTYHVTDTSIIKHQNFYNNTYLIIYVL